MTQEQLRMQMLAGIITEGQYKAKLNEVTVGEFPQYLVNLLNTDKEVREQLAIALDIYEDEITSEFKWEKVDGEKFITGDGMLITDDEYVIRRQAEEMETGYDTIEFDLPEVGNTELYYVWDPSF
jgi:phosphoribosylaminoimidazole (AIR) synthetase